MAVTERVQQLKQASLETPPGISADRARLITEFYRQDLSNWPVPVQRAKAFAYYLAHREIVINPGELIVGEKGHVSRHAPSFPELCCHSLEDLDLLNNREKIPYQVSAGVRGLYQEEIIPFWQGRSMRDKIFAQISSEWLDAYQAGIFTEFMEQRAPGHTVLDDKIYHKGMLDFIREIDTGLKQPGRDAAELDELEAMRIAVQALIQFAERFASLAEEMAIDETSPQRKAELKQIARVCSKVPAHAPETFQEALQYYWFVHLGVTMELNTWDSFNPGKLDQHLQPFYERGIQDGSLTRETAEELLQCFWIKFNNQPAPPKVGVTAEESGTYTDFAQINLGGMRPDGTDGVNDLTWLLLDVIEEMRLLQPSSSIQVTRSNPEEYLVRAGRIIRTGYGQPSVFNADKIVEELVRQGKSLEDARRGGSSGCVEVGAFGKESYILTGYFNIPKVLEITLNNGVDPETGRLIGLETGDLEAFSTFDEFYTAFEKQINYFINIKIQGNHKIEQLYAEEMPCPFLSILIDDCIAWGKDYHSGGARYNTSYIQGVGLGTITDCLAAIKHLVFAQQTITLPEFQQVLQNNFAGEEHFRQVLLNRTPKYGNDDDRADALMLRVFETYFNAVDGKPNWKGGKYHINLLPTTVHIYFGRVTGALPDGRLAHTPLSEGISPVQGSDRHGPTSVLLSAAKMDHARTGGTLLNQKFTPQLLETESSLKKFASLIRTYFRLGGHHIQFNVVDAQTLKDAKENPAQFRDLIVRVAGYSDYFCDLSEALQDEIITRTEQKVY